MGLFFFKRKKHDKNQAQTPPAFGMPAQPAPGGNAFSTQDLGSPIGQVGAGPLSSAAPAMGAVPKNIDGIKDPGFTSENGLSTSYTPPTSGGDLGASQLANYAKDYDVGGVMQTVPQMPGSSSQPVGGDQPSTPNISNQYDVGGTMVSVPATPDTPKADTQTTTDTAPAAAAAATSTIPQQYDVGGTMVSPPASTEADTQPPAQVTTQSAPTASSSDISHQYDVGGTMVSPPASTEADTQPPAQVTTQSAPTASSSDISHQYDVGGTMVSVPATPDTPKADTQTTTDTAPAAAAAATSTIPQQYDVGGTMVAAGPAMPDAGTGHKADLETDTDYLNPIHQPGKVKMD